MSSILKKRWVEILKILINSNEPITIAEIEKILQVSNKTIRNDLDEIEKYLEKEKLGYIIRKPGVGIWIEMAENEERKLKSIVYSKTTYVEPFSPEERQMYILTKLLEANKPIIMEDLAEKLFVSRITILKDLNQIEKNIEKYELLMLRKQNYGIEIMGEEKNFRKLVGDIIEKEQLRPYFFIPNKNYISSKHIFSHKNMCYIVQSIVETEEELGFKLTEEAINSLSRHIAISIERTIRNKIVEIDNITRYEVENSCEYDIACQMLKKIENVFRIKVPENEKIYIAMHLLGSKFQCEYGVNKKENVFTHLDKKLIKFAEEMIDLIGNILSIDLKGDKQLLTGLVLHLEPTINRLKYGFSIKNPLLEDIKKNYPSIFGASWASSILFEKYYGFKVTEEEIGYIAIHIGAALERQRHETKVVVVCSSGVGTSQLVSIRLEKAIPNLEITNVVSKYELRNIDINTYDLIISTVPIKHFIKPVIQISPFVDNKDIEEIKKWIKNLEDREYYERSVDIEDTSKLFSIDLIFPKLNLATKEEVISFLVDKLYEYNYVDKNFLEEVFERERVTSTAVGKGVAIPHGSSKFVNKQVVAVATLRKPIDWSGNIVDMVFMMAIKNDSTKAIKTAFVNFYNMLDDEEKLFELKNTADKEKIYKLLIL